MKTQRIDEMGDVCTAPEVAALLRLSNQAVGTMCRTGVFAGAYRAGSGRGVWRIPKTSVEAYITSRIAQATTPAA